MSLFSHWGIVDQLRLKEYGLFLFWIFCDIVTVFVRFCPFYFLSMFFLTLVTHLKVCISIFPETSVQCSAQLNQAHFLVQSLYLQLQDCLEITKQLVLPPHLTYQLLPPMLHWNLLICVCFSRYFSHSLIILAVVAAFHFQDVSRVTVSVLTAELDSPPGFFSDDGVPYIGSKLESMARNWVFISCRQNQLSSRTTFNVIVTMWQKNINKICDMAVKNTLNNKQCEQYLPASSNDGIQIHWIYSPHTLSHELTWPCFKNMLSCRTQLTTKLRWVIWKGIFVRKNTLEMRLVYHLDLPKQLTEGVCRSSILTTSMSTLHNCPAFPSLK